MSKQTPKQTPAQTEALKVEARKRALNSKLEALRSEAGIHRERLTRKSELLASCEREIKEAERRLQQAQSRQAEMHDCMTAAPGEIERLDGEMDKIKQELATMDNAALIAKAKDLAAQIAALRAAGFTVTPPEAKA